MPDGTITGDATLKARITGLLNQRYLDAVGDILASEGSWQWDDSNYTDFPRSTTSLVASQRDYTLPGATSSSAFTTFLTLQKLAVLDTAATENVLDESPLSEAELNQLYPTAGFPLFYKLIGGSVKLWPSPSASQTTLTNGLITYFQRTPSEFVTSDTTKEPGFSKAFHQYLSIGAALDYAATGKGMEEKAAYLTPKFNDMRERLRSHYGKNNRDGKLGLSQPAYLNFR